MNDIVPFAYGEQQVRTIVLEGEPWFVAADVARILGYRMASDMTRRIDPEDRGTRSVRTPGGGGDQDMTIISEPGLYTAVLGSQVAGAREFKRWVTHEVLPAIRKTGVYGQVAPRDLSKRELAVMVIEAEDAREAAEQKAAALTAQVDQLIPAARQWEQLAAEHGGDFDVRASAQILCRYDGVEIGQRRLFAFLRQIGWIDKNNRPLQRHVNACRLRERINRWEDSFTGEVRITPQLRITAKGLGELAARIAGPVVQLELGS